MDLLLPPSALERDVVSDHPDALDSTRCVDPPATGTDPVDVCEASTPTSATGKGLRATGCSVNESTRTTDGPPTITTSATTNTNTGTLTQSHPSNKDKDNPKDVKTGVVVADVGAGCRSPSTSFVDRLARLRRENASFALDDSMSNVSICDGDLALCMDTYDTIDCLEVDSKSPCTYTPIKSSSSLSKGIDLIGLHTRLDEPHVNISDDEDKNPVLASSIRRRSTCNAEADVARSLEVLGSSRCWTDKFDNEPSDPSLSATQSPVRSLASFVNSQADNSDGSFRRSTGRSFALGSLSPVCTPVRSYSRSVSRLPTSSNLDRMDRFSSVSVSEMMRMSSNPMCNVGLDREQVCKVRLSDDLELLYKHFKNLCTVLRRSGMRNEEPYFRILQVLVQRMSRRSFTMDHLLQMVWLAPNLVSIRWVLVSDSVRKKYAAEYKDSTDRVYDISIKVYAPGLASSDPHEYERICFRFKTVLCCWSLKCSSDRVENLRVPTARVPDKRVRSAHSTPMRDYTPVRALTPMRDYTPRREATPVGFDSTPIRLDDLTPSRSFSRNQLLPRDTNVLPTGIRNVSLAGSRNGLPSVNRLLPPNRNDLPLNRSELLGASGNGLLSGSLDGLRTPSRFTPLRTQLDYLSTTPTRSFRMSGTGSDTDSVKRVRPVEAMSPMSVDLLDTPGMRRIRENARKMASERRESVKRDDDLKFWIDMRWFTKILLEMIVGDTSPVMKIEFLVDFIMKYGSRKVNQDQVAQWVNTLCEIDPSILYKTESKFEDYTTVLTLNKSASLDNAVDYINQKIKTLKSF